MTSEPIVSPDAETVALAGATAVEVRTFLGTVRDVASGTEPGSTLPLLLLAACQLQVTGARLGAIVDVVPSDRFEPDTGPDHDVESVRTTLATLLGPVDRYADLADPVLSREVVPGSLSDDIATVLADLCHGLLHYEQGRVLEALWWWQYSYLSSWGERCAAAVRVLHGLQAHVRLDADEEVVMEAQLAALHGPAEDAPTTR